jgi:pyrroline-5-carboxylate reductase
MKFGIIGTGNMGGALAMAASKVLQGEDLLLANRTPEKAEALARQLGATVATNEEIASQCNYIFLGVKPQLMAQMLQPLQGVLKARQTPFVLVSMAAGLSIAAIQAMAGGAYPTIRIMPNTPVAVGAGMILYTASDNLTPAQVDKLKAGLSHAGIFDELPESLLDAGSAVSGCGGAFADLFVEGMADGGVWCGLPRAKAMLYAQQMLLGAAKLALDTQQHPGALKDAVCSPGGTTIAGVRALEEGSFRADAMNAVIAAYQRTMELKK